MTVDQLKDHLAQSIRGFILGEDNPASPAWQEEFAKHLDHNLRQAFNVCPVGHECPCHWKGGRS